MTDLVDRLRESSVNWSKDTLIGQAQARMEAEAADEIERLRAVLREVLDRQHEAVAIVNKQGAAFPGSLALACEKARAALGGKP